ncbi:MAG: hypothetical protein KGK11_09665 [Sphingomonadales bacterium]|nr:hypothetical protein [Sphingomonadales bacterium]
MIAALVDHAIAASDAAAFAATLEFGPDASARFAREGAAVLAQLHRRDSAGWTPGRAPSGHVVVLSGQLHNREALARELGCRGRDDAAVYAHALARWGTAVDERAIGHYAAIALLPDRAGLRLARSPFIAPPLHFCSDGARLVAGSSPRPLFWRREAPRRVALRQLARSRLIDFTDRFAGWYEGCHRLPLGAAVELRAGDWTEVWRYDLFARPRQRLAHDEDYVEAARALLDEGVAAALDGSRRPGVFLSGGLDSSLIAAAALRALPPECELPAFTAGPAPEWRGTVPEGRYAREFDAVAGFAALEPRLRPHAVFPDGHDFRHGMRELIAAMDCAPPALAGAWMQHGLFAAARAQQCDVVLWGDWGNFSISSAAPWAPVELFLRGQWLALARLLRHEPGDSRPMARRFLARVVLPLLPRRVWARVWQWRHGAPPDAARDAGLSRQWVAAQGLVEQARGGGSDPERHRARSRRELWSRLLAEDGQGHEQLLLGMEQLYGVTLRDPCGYRPLVEFCWGVPTRQFTRGPLNRLLARRMGIGRIPEAIRLNRATGFPHPDWHARIGSARLDLIAELDRMAADPDIAMLLDLPGLRQRLVDFPAEADHEDRGAYLCALPLAISAGRFLAYASGRNDI